uniref:Histone-binding protein N1/N2 n=1 Tax=Aceria tosichella TaxID=561515 RepID=A0A6G1SIA2_9ACAR
MAETSIEQQPAQPKDESVLAEANNLLVQGKRFMALEDYQSATDALEQAVQLYDAYYGVAKIQCADAYLEYGLALVALANLEAGSGTDKLMKKAGIEDGGEEEDEEADDEEGEDDDEEGEGEGDGEKGEVAMEQDTNGDDVKQPAENGTSSSKNEPVTNGKSESNHVDNKPQQNQGSSEPEPMPGTSSGHMGDGDQQDKDEDVENEEATTIEIAWEVLCLAKRLFMTDESLDGRLKLAETLQKLGEISIEWDNNDNAVSILEECLNIRKAILPPEDRLIALTYYNLGLAHSFKSDIPNANENFQHAISVIEKRIETLNKDLEKAKTGQDTVAVSTYEREINELKELLPDINMRMDDSKEDTSSEALKRTRDEIQQEDDEVKKVCLDKTKPVDDISHLVKRKAA